MKRKRFAILLLLLTVALGLCACAGRDAPYSFWQNGIEYLVDPQLHTISDGSYTYQYSLSGDSDAYQFTVTYPDGSSYHATKKDHMIYSGGDDDYRKDAYVAGEVLRDAAVKSLSVALRVNQELLVVALLLIGLGVLNLLFPKALLFLRHGWLYNAEPSDAGVLFTRVLGGCIAFCGILALFYALFGA